MRWRLTAWLLLALGTVLPRDALAASTGHGEFGLAVAANFIEVAQQLARRFGQEHHVRIRLTQGSTGRLSSQIRSGAPFDVLLAADADSITDLERDGLTAKGSRFTYAIGRLALWSPDARRVDADADVLRKASFAHLAMANPKLAPYGTAAGEVLQRMGLADALAPKLVLGESIGQAYTFVASGNAELGFVAWSQVLVPGDPPRLREGSVWLVPDSLTTPLRQDAVLLARAGRNAAARSFLAYLRSAESMALIRSYGYRVP